MRAYYESDDGAVVLYHARWEDGLAAGVFDPKKIALVHADPPYGVKERTDRASRGRRGVFAREGKKAQPKDYPVMLGDDGPFDPLALLSLNRPLVTWGANHYASRLPDSPSWLVWDKRDDTPPDRNADVEMAWSNLGGPARRLVHLWRGTCRASETSTAHLHVTQKPEALSAWVFAHAMARKKLKAGDTILVPYLGSGPDLRPALAIGCRAIAFEVERLYLDTAINARLRAVAQGSDPCDELPLFGR